MQKHDIYKRVFDFVVKVVNFCEKLAKSFSGRIIAKQLIRSATSIGANLEEADGATSKKDFINKMGISRKEAQETRYWLNLIKAAQVLHDTQNLKELEVICAESDEIAKILSSIINKTRSKYDK